MKRAFDMKLGWIDFSDKERRIVHNIIKALMDADTRDELGIGRIRDYFSNLFFPGTSVIQTRARYFLFIPWIYSDLEEQRVSSTDVAGKARAREMRIMEALKEGREIRGIIGSSAGKALRRLPSDIYWVGLCRWDIFRPGHGNYASRDMYHHSFDGITRQRKKVAEQEKEELIWHVPTETWHPSLPPGPDGLYKNVDFKLTVEEAEFLMERIRETCEGTLLDFLVSNQLDGLRGIDHIWGLDSDMPADLEEQIYHAENFSLLMYGAVILYNLLIAKMPDVDADYEGIKRKLADWCDEYTEKNTLSTLWTPDSLKSMALKELKIAKMTRQFITDWYSIASQFPSADALAENKNAADLIRSREVILKGKRARLVSAEARSHFSGSSGMFRLDFRWKTAREIITDIVEGLNHNA